MVHRPSNRTLRLQIANEAARLMAEQGDLPLTLARNKAAKRFNCHEQKHLPDNREIEQALRDHQNIFNPDPEGNQLRQLRETAIKAMAMLEDYHPLLIGSVLDGTAAGTSPIRLILFAETVEAVAMSLLDRKIPWDQREQSLDYPNKKRVKRPLFRFQAGNDQIDLLILPPTERHNLPLDRTEKRPHKGASLKQLKALLETD